MDATARFNELASKLLSVRVPGLSMAFMTVSLVLSILIPVGLLIFFKVKKKAKVKSFFIGAAIFIVFAMIVESLMHRIILNTPVGMKITENMWLYGLYGGFMAALFEEFGRFTAFKWILNKEHDNDGNALMYGAGHGGCEAILVLGISMLNNLILSLTINAGATKATVDSLRILPAEQAVPALESMVMLGEASSFIFLLGLMERIFAMTSHIAMSVPVWFAVKNKKPALFFISFGMHFLLDFGTVEVAQYLSDYAVEAIVGVISIIMVVISVMVYRKEKNVEIA